MCFAPNIFIWNDKKICKDHSIFRTLWISDKCCTWFAEERRSVSCHICTWMGLWNQATTWFSDCTESVMYTSLIANFVKFHSYFTFDMFYLVGWPFSPDFSFFFLANSKDRTFLYETYNLNALASNQAGIKFLVGTHRCFIICCSCLSG